MPGGDVQFIDVLPNMGPFARNLITESVKAGDEAGKKGGTAWSHALSSASDGGADALVKDLAAAQKKSAKVIDTETQNIAKARAAQKEASAKVSLAEQALADARAKYGSQSAQASAAEDKLTAARLREGAAAAKVTSVEDQLKAAHSEHREVTLQLDDAQKQLATGMGETTDRAAEQTEAWGNVKGATTTAGLAFAATFAALAAGTKVLFDVGSAFDTVSDTIRVGTGATGKNLEGLIGVAETVATSVPTSFEAAATTVADLNTRLGLTGDTATTVASQVLEAGRMMGKDLDIAGLTASFNLFGVTGDDIVTTMDHLFRVSQATGIGMDELASSVQTQGVALQELGFSYNDTASMIGMLDRAGLNADAVMASFGKGLVTLAKKGEEPVAAFQRVVSEIGGFIDAGDRAGALGLAAKVFGTKGATQFVGSLESGALALDSLTSSGLMSSDTILGVAAETRSFGETWEMFKNDVLLKIEPAATAVFGAISTGMSWIRDEGMPIFDNFAGIVIDRIGPGFADFGGYLTGTVVPALGSMGDWVSRNRDWLGALAVSVGAVVAVWGTWTLATKTWQLATDAAKAAQLAFNAVQNANPIMLVVTAIAALVAGLVYFFTQTETGREVWATFTDALSTAWSAVGDGIKHVIDNYILPAWDFMVAAFQAGWSLIDQWVIQPFIAGWKIAGEFISWAIQFFIVAPWNFLYSTMMEKWNWINQNIIEPFKLAMALLGSAFTYVKDNYIIPAWTAVYTMLLEKWTWIDQNIIAPFKSGIASIGTAFDSVKDVIGVAWDKIKEYAAKPVNFIIETVYMNGIKKTWDKIADSVGLDMHLPAIAPIAFADGSEDHRAQIAPAGAWRVWAEPETGGEAYIPLAESKRGRSTDILANVAARFGYGLQAYKDGGISGWAGDVWDKVSGAASGAWDWAKNTAGSVARFLKDPVGAMKDLISGPMNSLLESIGAGDLGKTVAGIPRKAVDGLIETAKRLVTGKNAEAAKNVGPVPGAPSSRGGPGMGWQAMWETLRSAFPSAVLTSSFRPGAITAVGTKSMHGAGRAIDVTPSMDIFNWLKANFPGSAEIIYSPAGGEQVLAGRNHFYGEPTRRMHFNHVHWGYEDGGLFGASDAGGLSGAALDAAFWKTLADGGIETDNILRRTLYDTGGMVPPGLTLVDNQTGKPEVLLNDDHVQALGGRSEARYELTINNHERPLTARDIVSAQRQVELLNPRR